VDLAPAVLSTIVSTPLTSTLQRFFLNRVIDAATTSFRLDIFAVNGASGPYDIVLRIGWPQIEQWSTAVAAVGGPSSPIRTTNAAATRASDVVTIALPNSTLDATIAALAREPSFTISSAVVAELNDGAGNNTFTLRHNSAGNSMIGISTKAGAQASVYALVSAAAADARFATAYGQAASGDAAISVNGGAVNAVTSNQPPNAVNSLNIGFGYNVNRQWGGYIERIDVYGIRADNTNLQRLATLATYGG
jgi:hypothetical protein